MHWMKFSNTETKEGDYGFGGQREQIMVSKVQGALGKTGRPKLKILSQSGHSTMAQKYHPEASIIKWTMEV